MNQDIASLTIEEIITRAHKFYNDLQNQDPEFKSKALKIGKSNNVAYFTFSDPSNTSSKNDSGGGRRQFIQYGPCGNCNSLSHDTAHCKKNKNKIQVKGKISKPMAKHSNAKKTPKVNLKNACSICSSAIPPRRSNHSINRCFFNPECDYVRKCTKCNKFGHYTSNCTSNNNVSVLEEEYLSDLDDVFEELDIDNV